MKHTTPLLFACALTLGAMGAATAQSVALSGMLGAKALLVIDGSAPKGVGVGESYRGVTVIATRSDQALVEVAGKRQTLRIGESQINAGGAQGGGDTKIVLQAVSNGHFMTQGQINAAASV